MQLSISDQGFLFKPFKNLLHGIKTMGLKLERHLTQLLFLTKKEKKLFAFAFSGLAQVRGGDIQRYQNSCRCCVCV